MEYHFSIPGTLPDLNDYLHAERQTIRNRSKFTTKGNTLKQINQMAIIREIRSQLKGLHIDNQIHITYLFVEKNKRRDKDNVASFAMKVIQDALVRSGTIDNDGWKNIEGFICDFAVDKENPRIEVILREVS